MRTLTPVCPDCGGDRVVNNGKTRQGRQNHRCKDCGRQFVQEPGNRIPRVLKEIADKMILKKYPVAEISDLTGISTAWIYERKRSIH